MASLQQLKNRLSGKSIEENKTNNLEKKVLSEEIEKPKSLSTSLVSSKKEAQLEIEEARYLLALIAKSEFSGKDIQIVYDTALKLQEIIKNNLEDNG